MTGYVSNNDVSLYRAGVDTSAGPLYDAVSLPHRAKMPSRLGWVGESSMAKVNADTTGSPG